jgi:formylglycine-generating enzyme required for sulfatase activity
VLPRSFAPAIASALALALCACGGEPDPPAAAAPAPAAADAAAPRPDPAAPRAASPWKPAPLLVPADARDALLLQAVEAEKRGHLFGDDPLGALDLYAALAAADPPMPEAQAGRERVVGLVAARFDEARVAGRLDDAEDLDGVLDVVRPDDAAARDAALAQARTAAAAVARGDARRAAGGWLSPRGDSAVFHYRAALEAQPGFAPAEQGLSAAVDALLARAEAADGEGDYDSAEAELRRASRLGVSPERVQDARAALAQRRAERAASALQESRQALERLDLPRAAQRLAEAKAADPQAPGLDALSQRLATARRYGHFLPGQRFADALADGGTGPAMVVVPHGGFTMGAGDGEEGARDNEGPAHAVRFERGFALALHETTVAEFARFVAATGYRTVAERSGRSSAYDERGGAMVEVRGAHWRRGYQGRRAAGAGEPVLHVAFDDAAAYAEWLSARSGQRYRLPSEAEFEYALRGGEQAPWAWGATLPRRALGNLTGEGDVSPQGRRWGRAIRGWADGHWGPAPVGRYPAEAFGTHDLIGNVSEWVEDCWHDSYRRAPADGRAWVNPGCDERVVRGGSWASTLEQSRSAFRLQVPADLSSARVGFRVARDL